MADLGEVVTEHVLASLDVRQWNTDHHVKAARAGQGPVIDNTVVNKSLSSLSVFVCLSVCISLFCVCVSLCLSVCLSVSAPSPPSLSLSLSLSLYTHQSSDLALFVAAITITPEFFSNLKKKIKKTRYCMFI